MKRCFIIAVFGILLAGLPHSVCSAEEDRIDDEAQRDLTKLQGKWETTLRAGGRTILNVQTIKGTKSTVERFDEKGELLQSHTADFKLNVNDQVRVFTFFDLRVTAGPQKGKGFNGPLSFIYVLKPAVWIEARGLMADQRDGEPRLMIWKRVVEDKVTTNFKQAQFLALEDQLR